jgi:hypothetical protein
VKRLQSFLVAAVMFVCALDAAAQCPPAATSTATQNSPNANTSFPLGASIPFSWTAPNNTTGLTGYEVFLYNTTSNTQQMVCQTTATSCTSGNINTAARYGWFVRTKYTSCPAGTGNDTAARILFVGCPAVPSIVSPTNGTTNVPTTVNLQWSDALADTYDIFLNVGTSCTATTPSGTSTTLNFSPPPLNAGGTYSWKVTAKKGQCAMTSSCATFSTDPGNCPTSGPTLVSPANNAVLAAGAVTLSWNPVANATAYDVFVGLDGANPGRVATTTNTSATLTVAPGRTVRWFVATSVSGCQGRVSNETTRMFTTPPCATGTTRLSQPADNATLTNLTVTFSWETVAGALGYDVFLSNDGGSNFTQLFSTSTSTNSSRVLTAGTYQWYVRTRFGTGCTSTDSDKRTFTISQSTCPTDKATLDAPANATSSPNPITFQWAAVARATGYKLYAVTAASNTPVLLGTTTTLTRFTPASLPQGTLTWYVRTTFENCPETESDRRTVTVTASSTCPTAAPTPTSPANGASNVATPVKFTWTAVTNAARYRLMVSLNGASASAVALTTETQATINVPAASAVEWYAEGLFDDCPATQSAHFRFATATSDSNCATNPGVATLVSPANGATSVASPVTFQWSAVSGATGYRVIASIDNSNVTLGSTTTATSLTANVPAGLAVWYVQTLFGDCPTTLSARGTFTVTSGSSCANNQPPALVSPAQGAADVTSPVELRWNPVTGAIAYKLYVAINNSSEFQLIGATTDTHVIRIVPAGITQWYVVAQFLGCDDTRSVTGRFTVVEPTCTTPTITLNAPIGSTTVTSPVTFSWSSIPDATSYRVWVSIDGSAPTQVARVNATTVTGSIPSGNAVWYVEGLRASCPAVLSTPARFVVQAATNCGSNAPPNLLSPQGTPASPGTAASPVEFSWSAAPNAIAYKVWVSLNDQPFADVGFTTATTLRRDAPAGKYAWFVEVFFNGCPSLQSARGAFTIAATTPRCSGDAPSIIAPADGASTSSPVTFLWSSVSDAVLYRVYIQTTETSAPILLGTTPETSLTKVLPPGQGYWSVEAVFRDCNPARSGRARITIPQGTNCPSDPPTLVAPANGADGVGSPVDFVWNPVSGAIRYVLVIKLGDGAATAVGETTATQLTKQLPPGRIEWWVVAFFANCRQLESAHFRFNVAIPEECRNNRKPVLLTPRSGSENVTSPVTFSWSAVAHATRYRVWAAIGDAGPSVLATTTATHLTTNVPAGRIRWFVEANFDICPPTNSAIGDFTVVAASNLVCRPAKPIATVAGQVLSGTQYGVRWTPLPNITVYELQESTTADFSNATTQTVNGVPFATFTHTATNTAVEYSYRVRGVSSCADERGPYSDVVSVFVVPLGANGSQRSASAEIGTQQAVVQQIFIPGQSAPVSFAATSDKEWIRITPATGVLPVAGITLTVTADPSILALGTNTGSVIVTFGAAGGARSPVSLDGAKNTYAVSVSLVTPVAPSGKNTPPDDALIIPAVAHAGGANDSLFESDVRVTNLSAETIKYLLSFTPSATDGTLTGSSSEIEIEPGATTALDDILADFFGDGNAGATTGTLEIRPISTSQTTNSVTTSGSSTLGVERVTVASSRTFNSTPTGTFGQFVPAIPYSQFVGRTNAAGVKNVLSLQQIAQSASYRTNFGFVEASGEPAELLLRVFNAAGNQLAEIPLSLLAGEHRQINQLLALNNISLEDGRVEVEVTSDTGRVTAYASVLDAKTNDPLLVSPVVRSSVSGTRYVLPGVADLNTGAASWRTDMRLFNAGEAAVTATLTYYPQANSGPSTTKTVQLNAGEVRAIDNVLGTMFGITNSGGSMVVTTEGTSSIVPTARTYNQTGNGTYGQFIPGVTPAESIGLDERTLQILQLEYSSRFRTNVGVVETSGEGATVEVYLHLPDSRVTPRIEVALAPNELRQFSLDQFGLGSTIYNARIAVRVIDGTGRVTAYGSVIDEQTQDPTYVPTQ